MQGPVSGVMKPWNFAWVTKAPPKKTQVVGDGEYPILIELQPGFGKASSSPIPHRIAEYKTGSSGSAPFWNSALTTRAEKS